MNVLHLVVPEGIGDPARPSGGNVYDARIARELAARGWRVHLHEVEGSWPVPSAADQAALAGVVAGIADGAAVLVDGLVASAAPEVLVPASRRLRLVVLVHMPLGAGRPDQVVADAAAREAMVLAAAAAVVTTSAWARRQLLDRYSLPSELVHVAEPGVDRGRVAAGTSNGGELLCVAAVTPHKGHDVLLAALSELRDLPWCCTWAGRLDRDPRFVEDLCRRADEEGIRDRLRLTGPLTGPVLEAAYTGADVLVLASQAETYAMVVTEALAHGLPVVATAAGGLPEALGRAPGGILPGLLVPPNAPAALAQALRAWLGDAELRQRLRTAARQRRAVLSGWSMTADRIATTVQAVG